MSLKCCASTCANRSERFSASTIRRVSIATRVNFAKSTRGALEDLLPMVRPRATSSRANLIA